MIDQDMLWYIWFHDKSKKAMEITFYKSQLGSFWSYFDLIRCMLMRKRNTVPVKFWSYRCIYFPKYLWCMFVIMCINIGCGMACITHFLPLIINITYLQVWSWLPSLWFQRVCCGGWRSVNVGDKQIHINRSSIVIILFTV